jgi:acyl dehydratase
MATIEELEPHIARLRTRIGRQSAPKTRRIEAGALIKFAKAIGETDPLYLDEDYARTTRFGGLIAAPTYVSTFTDALGPDLFDFDLPLARFLHSDDAVENFSPIRPGDEIATVCRYVDAYARPGRAGPLLFQVVELRLTRADEPVAKVRVASVSFD